MVSGPGAPGPLLFLKGGQHAGRALTVGEAIEIRQDVEEVELAGRCGEVGVRILRFEQREEREDIEEVEHVGGRGELGEACGD